MIDMSAVIAPKSDQLNSDDLIAGPRTIRIRDVTIRPGTEQPVSIFYDDDDGKPWKPCKSASRVLVAAWGPDAKSYAGRSVTIYRDPDVKWGGMAVGGIRISALSHIERPLVMALTEKKGSKKIATIQPLTIDPPVQEYSIQQAEHDLRISDTLAQLEAAWKRKAMAPHREALRSVLDECKATLTEIAAVEGADA